MKKLKIKANEMFEIEITSEEGQLLYKGYLKDCLIEQDVTTGRKTISFDERKKAKDVLRELLSVDMSHPMYFAYPSHLLYFDKIIDEWGKEEEDEEDLKELASITVYNYKALKEQYGKLKSIDLLKEAIKKSIKLGWGLEPAVEYIIKIRDIK
jgi:hypothetical protein